MPVFNIGENVKYAIESVLSQEYKKWELIIVDDGSTDNTSEICGKYSINHRNIYYYRKEKEGVSSARNFGIDKSNGTWILFLDADDYLSKNTLELMHQCIEKNKVNIIQGKIVHCSEYFEEKLSPMEGRETFIIRKDQMIRMLLNPYKYRASEFCVRANLLNSTQGCYAKLFNKSFLLKNRIRFNTNLKLGEDFIFYYDCLNKSNDVVVLNAPVYFYVTNPKSVTNSSNLKLIDYLLEFMKEGQLRQKQVINDEIREDWYTAFYMHMKLIINKALTKASEEESVLILYIKKMRNNPVIENCFNHSYKYVEMKSLSLYYFFLKTKLWALKKKRYSLFCKLCQMEKLCRKFRM